MLATLLVLASLGGSPLDGPFHDLAFDVALERAKEQEKVVFVDFFTTWCGPCKQLDATTWKNDDVVRWLGENTVALKLDAEVETELANHFRVSAYPTMIFVAPDGTERGRIVGYRDAAQFLEQAPKRLAGESELVEIDAKLEQNADDMMLRMDRGDVLVRERRYEEALAEYLYCFDEGRDAPGFGGVRLSFLLGDISRLGQAYPPALDALRLRAKGFEAKLRNGIGTFADAHDMCALHRELGQPERNLEVFDLLREAEAEERNELLVTSMFRLVVEQLVEAERYQDILDFAGDPLDEVRESLREFELTSSFAQEMPDPEEVLQTLRKLEIDGAEPYVVAYFGLGRDEEALELANVLLEFHPVAATATALSRLARKTERLEAAAAILDRAEELLPEEEHRGLARERRRLER